MVQVVTRRAVTSQPADLLAEDQEPWLLPGGG